MESVPDGMIVKGDRCEHPDEEMPCDFCRVWTHLGWMSYRIFNRRLERETRRALDRLRKAGLV